MCGYLRRTSGGQTMREYYEAIQLPVEWPKNPKPDEILHMYPAFGGVASKQIKDLVIDDGDAVKAVDATWWFDCQELDGELIVGKRTTFNARNLDSPYWKGAVHHHRGIAIATGLGESLHRNGKKFQYLMESEKPILLGCVYRRFPGGLYSCAVITRDSHERFDKYHDKAFPLMLPHDPEFLELWLSGEREDHPVIADLLARPRIFNDLQVTPVKTFKDALPVSESELLFAD